MTRSRTPRVLFTVAPLLLVLGCGDDTESTTGGGGGGGTTSVVTSSTSAGPTSSSSSSSSPTSTSTGVSDGGGPSSSSGVSDGGGPSQGGGGSTNDGGGGSTSEGGGGNTSDGGGGSSSQGGGGSTGEGGTGGGTGGSGGAPPADSGLDACPGDPYTLDFGDSVSLRGDTSVDSLDDYDTCQDPDPNFDGADRVYAFTLTGAGSFRATLTDDAGFDGNLVVRETCLTSAAGDICYPNFAFGDQKTYARHLEAGTYYVIVETAGTETGTYTLTAQFTAPGCGDRILNPGEECDLGTAPNDGCGDPGTNDECTVEDPPEEVDTCDGEQVILDAGTTTFLASDGYTTLGFNDTGKGSCTQGTAGPDRIMALDPQVSGMVNVRIGYDENNEIPVCAIDSGDPGCWDQVLYVRSECANAASQFACVDLDGGAVGESLTFPVEEGVISYLFIDGYNDQFYSRGPFNLFITLTP